MPLTGCIPSGVSAYFATQFHHPAAGKEAHMNGIQSLFSMKDKVVVITGAGGVLCSSMARGLSAVGAHVAICDLQYASACLCAEGISGSGAEAVPYEMDVLKRESVIAARDQILAKFGRIDVLINGAGGNRREATTSADLDFFNLDPEAIRWVFDLNLMGTLLPCQVFGEVFRDRGEGVILNISSMNALRPLTRIPAYSGAKAAVSNFTQWLAVHLAQNYSPRIRVNALAPGFFMTQQNRFLLTDEATGQLTPRGQTIITHTPQGRFGEADDLLGATLWLVSDASAFVTGIVVPVDGGFSAFSGV